METIFHEKVRESKNLVLVRTVSGIDAFFFALLKQCCCVLDLIKDMGFWYRSRWNPGVFLSTVNAAWGFGGGNTNLDLGDQFALVRHCHNNTDWKKLQRRRMSEADYWGFWTELQLRRRLAPWLNFGMVRPIYIILLLVAFRRTFVSGFFKPHAPLKSAKRYLSHAAVVVIVVVIFVKDAEEEEEHPHLPNTAKLERLHQSNVAISPSPAA